MKITKSYKHDHEKITYALAEAFNQWKKEMNFSNNRIGELSGFSATNVGQFSNHKSTISSTFILWCIFNVFDPLNYQVVWDAFEGMENEKL